MPKTISKSRLNRRLHAIKPELWRIVFALLAEEIFKQRNPDQTYVVDSFPLPVCDNILRSAAAAKKKSFRGYIPSKRRYYYYFFYGLRVHLW